MKTKLLLLVALLCAAFVPAFADSALSAGDGSTVQISIASVDGTAPFTYQWSKDGVVITGATNALYQINAVKASDAGVYTCVVKNSAGQTVSDRSVLTYIAPAPVILPPANAKTKAVRL